MKRSTVILALAGLFGVPIWILPDARLILGRDLFLGLSALSAAGFVVGMITWYRDGE